MSRIDELLAEVLRLKRQEERSPSEFTPDEWTYGNYVEQRGGFLSMGVRPATTQALIAVLDVDPDVRSGLEARAAELAAKIGATREHLEAARDAARAEWGAMGGFHQLIGAWWTTPALAAAQAVARARYMRLEAQLNALRAEAAQAGCASATKVADEAIWHVVLAGRAL